MFRVCFISSSSASNVSVFGIFFTFARSTEGGGLKLFGQCPYRTNTFQKGASLKSTCLNWILQDDIWGKCIFWHHYLLAPGPRINSVQYEFWFFLFLWSILLFINTKTPEMQILWWFHIFSEDIDIQQTTNEFHQNSVLSEKVTEPLKWNRSCIRV